MLNIRCEDYTVQPDNLLSSYMALAIHDKNRGALEYEYILIKHSVNHNNIVTYLKINNYGLFDIVEYDDCVTVDDACNMADNDVIVLTGWELYVTGTAVK